MRLGYLVGVMSIALISAACSKKSGTPITNTDDGWSYVLPAGFVKRNVQLPKGITQYMGPEEDRYQVNLVIESLPGKETAEQVGTEIAKDPPPGLIIQDHAPYSAGGLNGYSVKGTRDKGAEGQRQVYFTDHGICVIFTVTSSIKTFDDWDQVLKETFKDFHWTKKGN